MSKRLNSNKDTLHSCSSPLLGILFPWLCVTLQPTVFLLYCHSSVSMPLSLCLISKCWGHPRAPCLPPSLLFYNPQPQVISWNSMGLNTICKLMTLKIHISNPDLFIEFWLICPIISWSLPFECPIGISESKLLILLSTPSSHPSLPPVTPIPGNGSTLTTLLTQAKILGIF